MIKFSARAESPLPPAAIFIPASAHRGKISSTGQKKLHMPSSTILFKNGY